MMDRNGESLFCKNILPFFRTVVANSFESIPRDFDGLRQTSIIPPAVSHRVFNSLALKSTKYLFNIIIYLFISCLSYSFSLENKYLQIKIKK
jgi:hypothetical protein